MLVKHPENLYKLANERGLLSDVVFYYQLKSVLPQDGKFLKNNYSINFSKEFKLSRAAIKKKILRLKSLNLLREYTNYYRLASYNTLFTLLGYTFGKYGLKLFYNKDKIKLVKTDFKKEFGNLYDIKSYFAYSRIRENLEKQRNEVRKKFVKEKMKNVEKSARRRVRNSLLKFWSKLPSDKINILQESLPSINFDITLSLNGIARLLGYKNISSAYSTVEKLKELLLLKSARRVEIYIQNFKSKFLPKNLFAFNNSIYIYKANMITCLL